MKKLLSVILAVVLIFGLCGCLNITISKDSNTSSAGSQQSSSGGSSSASQYADMSGYTIICVSSDGNAPVAGVNLQFCSDSKCMMGVTDANGISNFDVPDGEYDVHIQSVPDGYDMPSEAEFKMTPDSKQHTVVIPGVGASSLSESESQNSSNNTNSTVAVSAAPGIISGEAFDINGNIVDFQQLFNSANYTLLNLFMLNCEGCYEEFPELTKLNSQLSQNNGQVVLMLKPTQRGDGTSYDDLDQQEIQQVISDLEQYGAQGMKVVIYNPNVTQALEQEICEFPSSFVIDSQGKVLSGNYPGDRNAQAYAEWISQFIYQ